MPTVPFKVVKKPESLRAPKQHRRSWSELIAQIVAATEKQAIFVSLADVSEADMKYLTLALSRRGKGERLRTQRVVMDGVDGRLLWSEVVRDAGA